jgi:hypothetical protein
MQDEELPPYEDDDQDAQSTTAEGSTLDFSQPDQPVLDSPMSPSPPPGPQPPNSDIDWDEYCDQNRLYPVILAPFIYFGRDEELEEELCERYGTYVRAWFLGVRSIVLAYTDRERALLAIENQREAARHYLAEPSAGAIHPTAIPGTLVEFSTRSKLQIGQRVSTRSRARSENFPIPPRVMGINRQGRPAVIADRPPETRFDRGALAGLLAGTQDLHNRTRGSSHHLMSRYSIEPVLLVRLLELRHGSEQATGMVPTPLGTLISLLRRHLSYNSPLALSIPLPQGLPLRDILASVAHDTPLILPTSLMARGTYDAEYLKWSNAREVYEIIIDEIPID